MEGHTDRKERKSPYREELDKIIKDIKEKTQKDWIYELKGRIEEELKDWKHLGLMGVSVTFVEYLMIRLLQLAVE